MPRPPIRRRRQNSFVLKKQANIPNIPNPAQTRQALEQKLSAKPVGKRPRDSDDSDDLVVPGSAARTRKRQEIFASGAVAKGDQPGAYPTRAQRTRAMRENTVEILSHRSGSTSRASSTSSTQPPRSVTDPKNTLKRPAALPSANGSVKKRKSAEFASVPDGTDRAIAQTPQPEGSILGKIKPRKRQASILQLIENDQNNDSSILHSDDEERFLPDEISTPVKDSQNAPSAPSIPRASLLKRKRDSDLTRLANTYAPDSSTKATRSQELPQLSRSQRRKLSHVITQVQDDDDVLAPPESSDEENASNIPSTLPQRASKRSKPATFAPSTEQLQSLMPSKKHILSRPRRQRGEFEISEESVENSDDDAVEEHDHSTFSPINHRRTQSSTRAKSAKQAAKSTKARAKPKGKPKSTKTISHTPSPVRLRAPLPLSSFKSGNIQAKSPSKQDTPMRSRTANTLSTSAVTPNLTKGTRKRYGGSRRQAPGKENQLISLSELSSDDTTAEKLSHAANNAAVVPEVTAWNKKWADVDKFDLEFEEVSISTRSSSPNAR